jgi:RHS repeat-associated protein
MSQLRFFLRAISIVSVFAFLAISPAAAQVDPDPQLGIRPYESLHAGDIDVVSLTNGTATVQIPLISYPQLGGKLKLDFALTFINQGGYSRQQCTGPLPQQCTTIWVPRPNGFRIADLGNELVVSGVYIPTVGAPAYTTLSVAEGNGSTHFMGKVGSTWESIDATAFRLDPSTNIITDADGVRTTAVPCIVTQTACRADISSEATSRQDTNGNRITFSSTGGWTDTIGRNIAIPVTTTNATGCTGPLPVHSITAWNPPGLAGGVYALKFCYAEVPAILGSGPTAINLVNTELQSVVLPNNTTWTFQYDTSGNLNQITFPTGGSLSYTWASGSCVSSNMNFVPAVLTRTMNANDGSPAATWTYNETCPTSTTVTTTVTDPAGNASVHTGTSLSGSGRSGSYYETLVKYYQGSSAGTLLKTIQTDYSSLTLPTSGTSIDNLSGASANVMPIRTTTTWPNAKVSKVENDPDGASFTFTEANPGITASFAGIYGKSIAKREFDFGTNGPGSLLRRTAITYLGLANASYRNSNILNPVSSVLIYDSTANQCKGVATYCSSTTYGYDENNGSPLGTFANQTSVTRGLSGGTALKTQTIYNAEGMPTKTIDPAGNSTTLTYDVTGLFLSQIQYPDVAGVHHIESFSYDKDTGVLDSRRDQNSNQTSYQYDSMLRVTTATFPDSGQTTSCYTDTGGLTCTKAGPPYQVIATRLATPSPTMTITTSFDGLGRVKQTSTSDTDCASGDKVDTTYNTRGLLNSVSNPYCTAGEPTSGLTTYTYDGLSRVTQVSNPDNSTVSTNYTGRATQVQDEGNGMQRVTRTSQIDGMGRLVSVCEVAPGPFVGAGGASSPSLIGSGGTPGACTNLDITGTGFLTTFQYDALDNLLGVSQSGVTPPRAFTYDSLSRLLTASNPESGVTTYKYDSDTTCTSAPTFTGDLVSKADARGVRTCFQYDALHRLTEKSYTVTGTVAPTLPALFGYDQSLITMGSQQFTIANSIGRPSWSCSLTSAGFCNGDMTANSYDAMGRVAKMWQENPVNSNNIFIAYTYDLLGNEIDRNLNNNDYTSTYNSAGRLVTFNATNFTNATNPPNLLAGAHYDAAGHITSATLANGLTESWKYDKRERMQAGAVGTNCTNGSGTCSGSTAYGFSLTFAPNGNVLTSNDTVNGNWTYGYDAFNRLTCSNLTSNGTCASPTSGKPTFSYVYDRSGNRWQQNGPATFMANFTGGTPTSPANNNRMDGYSYDAAGDLLNDQASPAHSFSYDAEYRLASVNGGATTYAYNPKGQRVAKTVSGVTTDFIYDLGGHPIITTPDNPTFIEMYVAGMHLGTYTVNAAQTASVLYYDHADWLGTERARTNLSGVACEKTTSYAFGDGQAVSNTCGQPVSPRRFTGKERDTETNLDNFQARYFASSMGRFVSTDLFTVTQGRVVDPQQLNLYAYVRNNPLKHIDPTGMLIDDAGCQQDFSHCGKNWQKVQDVINQKDKNGNYLHPELHKEFVALQNDSRTFVIENAKLGQGVAGEFTITNFTSDGKDFTRATVQLDFNKIKAISNVSGADFVPGFNKYQGLLNSPIYRMAETFGHEAGHGLFSIQNPGQAADIQTILNQRDAAIDASRYPYPPDVMQKIQQANEAMIPTETFAQQQEKIINGELRADKKKQ